MAAAVTAVHLLGTLTAQIDWAQARFSQLTHVNTHAAYSLSTWDAARLVTVSPVWRFNKEPGIAAWLLEALWLALFLTLLLSLANALARRSGPPGRFVMRQSVILPLVAPVAAMLALLITRLPGILQDREPDGMWQRIHGYEGPELPRLVGDAYTLAPHALLLGLAATVTGLLYVRLARWPFARVPRSAKRRVLFLLSMLRGPMRTLWPRIGETVLATVAATACAQLLALPALARAARLVFDHFCPADCGQSLAGTVLLSDSSSPPTTPQEILMQTFIMPTGHLWFTGVFAVAFFVLRALPGFRPRPMPPATLFVLFWAAYTVGRTGYHLYVQPFVPLLAEPPTAEFGSPFRAVLIAPEPLRDALFSAPATATLVTAVLMLFRSVRRRAAARHLAAGTPGTSQQALGEGDTLPQRSTGASTSS